MVWIFFLKTYSKNLKNFFGRVRVHGSEKRGMNEGKDSENKFNIR